MACIVSIVQKVFDQMLNFFSFYIICIVVIYITSTIFIYLSSVNSVYHLEYHIYPQKTVLLSELYLGSVDSHAGHILGEYGAHIISYIMD